MRRINIRQIIRFKNSAIDKNNHKIPIKLKNCFNITKEKIRNDIDRVILQKMLPTGLILKNVMIEKIDKYLNFGRQIGAYPILVGTAEKTELFKFYDFIVCGHGFRSVSGLLNPININSLSYNNLKNISGLDKKDINNIIFNRPFNDCAELLKMLPAGKANILIQVLHLKCDKQT